MFVVLFAVALAVGILLIPAFHQLMVPTLERPQGVRLMGVVEGLAAGVSGEPRTWERQVSEASAHMNNAEVSIIWAHPGKPAFKEDCRSAGVDPKIARNSFWLGPQISVAQVPVEADGDDVSKWKYEVRWLAMAPLKYDDRDVALLIAVDKGHPNIPRVPLWTLAIGFGALVLVVVSLVGGLVGHFLLIRPIERSSKLAHRMVDGGSDLEAIYKAVMNSARIHREDQQRIDRRESELARIRTDLKGAQSSLIRAEKLASVGQLAAGFAHEIGNPVGVAMGLSEILMSDEMEPVQAREFAREINHAISRVDVILKDLLTFARPSREEGAITDIRAMTEATLNLLDPHKQFRNINTDLVVRDDGVRAEIKPTQFQQVLLNLLLNAAQAMKGEGNIVVTIMRDKRWAEIVVADSGPGISREQQERIFDPFFTTKPPGEGTGLGLSMSAHILEVYGGELTVDSVEGRGATFTIRLWAIEEPA